MNLETKITIYKFTPQVFTLTLKNYVNYLIYGIVITSLLLPYKRKNRFQHIFVCICLCSVSRLRLCKGIG